MHNEIWITVYESNGLQVEILYHMADSPRTFLFTGWQHFYSYLGDAVALSNCVIRVHAHAD